MGSRDDDSPVAALGRVRLVAAQTLAEALRLRLTVLLACVGATLVLLPTALRSFNLGTAEVRFIADFGLAAIGLAGTVLATFGLAHLCFGDLDGGLAALVLTRRLGRGEYLAGKLAGVTALLAWFTAALALVLAAVLTWRGAQPGADVEWPAALLQACALTWLKLTLSAAMTLLVCSYAGSAFFAGSAGLLLTVAAHLRVFAPTDGWLAWMRVWPDFGLFERGPGLAGRAAPGLAGLGAYWLFFMILFAGLAAYVFRRREL